MKKILLGLALSTSMVLSAQIDFYNTKFGVSLGANYSRVSNAHNPSGPRIAMQGGLLALIPIGNNDQFYLQPEVVYYGAGETGKEKDAKGTPGYNAVYGNNYISVPIYFKGYFSEAESEFFGLFGPRFNFLISQNIKDPSRDWYNTDKFGKANGFGMALGAGIGFSYKRQLELALKFDYGLTNTYPDLKYSPDNLTNDASVDLKKSEHVLSIGISYIFQ